MERIISAGAGAPTPEPGHLDQPSTIWRAMAGRRFVLSEWPWRSVCYLGTGVLCGAATTVLLLSLVTVGMVLSAALVGVPLLAAVCLAGVPVCALERRRVGWISAEPVPDPHAPVARPGFAAWLRFRLSEPATWRELGYAFLSCLLLWPIDLAVLFLGLLLPLGTLYGAVTVLTGFNDQVRLLPGWTVDSTGQAALLVPLSLLALPIGAYLIGFAAGARAGLTRLALRAGDPEDGDRLVELTRSRARLVDAFEAERRRIERDLHDGAQQRLLALTMTVGLARMSEGAAADALLVQAQDQAKQALSELRELIRGIHPQVLTDRGLPSAVADLADRASVPVSCDFDLPGRLPRSVESVAYFVICEALANAAKHSGADRVEVSGRLRGDLLIVEIRDNGSGGATAAAGSGLAGLADRLSVVEGRLLVSSPPGGPTVLRAEIPAAVVDAAVAVAEEGEH
jgi:signal transduction histidine kinase